MEEIEILNKQSQTRKFYNTIKKMNKGYQPKAEGCKDKDEKVIKSKEGVVKRLQEHFSILLNKGDLNMEVYEIQQQ
jgi:pyruvate kinase